jgi:hypothetical protein
MAIPKEYRGIVGTGARAAGVAGVPGAFSFGLDVIAMGSIWTAMIIAIAGKSNHKIDKAFAAKITSGVLAGVAAYLTGSKIAMKIFHFIPGIGTLSAIGINSSLNYLFTYKFGSAIVRLFSTGQFSTLEIGIAVMSILCIVIKIPTWNEASDMVALATEPMDNGFEAFVATVQAERERRGM